MSSSFSIPFDGVNKEEEAKVCKEYGGETAEGGEASCQRPGNIMVVVVVMKIMVMRIMVVVVMMMKVEMVVEPNVPSKLMILMRIS